MAEIDGGDRKAREEMAEVDGGDLKAGEEIAVIDGDDRKARESECLFVWDDASNLYFHSSSGFYHDPNAGWYYSSRDGLYYTFENGTYVPLTFDKGEESEPQERTTLLCSGPVEINQCIEEQSACDGRENHCPPSEWLEETLIDIYLSGHSNLEAVASLQSFDASLDEEKWQAQHDQVVRTADVINFPVIDLWKWELVVETVKKRQQVTRLFGRLIRPSSKLHPSVPSEGGCFKTASI